MDLIEFAQKYYLSHTNFQLQAYEVDYLRSLQANKSTLTFKSRQMNFSTLLSVYISYLLIFDDKHIGLFSCNNQSSAIIVANILSILKNFKNEYPDLDIRKSNKNYIQVGDNRFHSLIDLCGYNLDVLIFDEAAHIKNIESKLTGFGPGREIHIVTTPTYKRNILNRVYEDSNSLFFKQTFHYSMNPIRYTPERISQLKNILSEENWDIEMELIPPPLPKSVKVPVKDKIIRIKVSQGVYDELERQVSDDRSISENLKTLIKRDLSKPR